MSSGWVVVSQLIATFLFLSYLLALSLFDWKKKLLPLEPMMVATIGLFLFRVIQFGVNGIIMSALGILVGAGFIGAQVWISKGRWMGRGDIWLAASVGAFLMFDGMLMALYLTYVVGGVLAILLFVTGVYKRGQRIAFTPFLTIGAIGSLLWGPRIFIWFASAFGLG